MLPLRNPLLGMSEQLGRRFRSATPRGAALTVAELEGQVDATRNEAFFCGFVPGVVELSL